MIVDEMGWLYFVGPICARQFFEGEFARRLAEFERTEDESAARDFLISNLARFGAMAERCESLVASAIAAQTLHSNLLRLRPLFREINRAFSKQDGWLRVDREYAVPLQNGGVRMENRSENFALIKGAAAASLKFELTQKIDAAKHVLTPFSGSESDSLDVLCAIERNGRLVETTENIRKVEVTLSDVENALHEFSEFFSADNFREIRRWSLDKQCPIRFSVSIHENSRTISLLNSSKPIHFDTTSVTSAS